MKAWQRLLCAVGLHDWTRWSDPYERRVQIITTRFGSSETVEWVQSDSCGHCGLCRQRRIRRRP